MNCGKKAFTLVAGVTTVICLMSTTSQGAVPIKEQVTPIKADAEPSVFSHFETTVAALATTSPTSYAGEVHVGGRVILFLAHGGEASVTKRLTTESRLDHVNFAVKDVRFSLDQLIQFAHKVNADRNALKKQDGASIESIGPDIQSNSVEVTFYRSVNGAIGLMNRDFARPGTPSIVSAPLPSGTASALPSKSSPSSVVPEASRFADSAPFYGADAIWPAGNSSPTATSGFDYYGQGSGNLYMLTAGHSVGAAGQKIYTNTESPKVMGTVSTNYWPNDNETADFASISGSFEPNVVYGSGTTTYTVTTTPFLAQVGDAVSTDGWVSGLNHAVGVYAIDQELDSGGKTVYPVTFGYKSGSKICVGGDSGSPVLEFANGQPPVQDAGIAVAELIIDGSPDPSYCGYQDASVILQYVNGALTPP